jgi:Protein of unknown function (DUF3800)
LRKQRAANPTTTLTGGRGVSGTLVFQVHDEDPSMKLCYVDESGCTGALPSAISPIQPLFAIFGLMIDQSKIEKLTLQFLQLKKRFFPRAVLSNNLPPKDFLDWVLYEPKGSDLRKNAIDPSKRVSRQALMFFDEVLKLIEASDCRFVGRIWIKGVGTPFNGPAVYTSSVQRLCEYFDHFLRESGSDGIVIADSRTKDKNAKVSHSIFTQRFRAKGNAYPNLVDMPVFGHSDNHVGLQLCDLVCSGLLFPIAVHTYCAASITSLHVRPGYRVLKERFAARIEVLQHRYLSATGKWSGGIVTSDAISQQSGKLLFTI